MYSQPKGPGSLVLGGCFPDECDDQILPLFGSLRYSEISSCMIYHWDAGSKINVLLDPRGFQYIMTMGSTSIRDANRKLGGSQQYLPSGWKLYEVTVGADFNLSPEASDSTLYTVGGDRARFGTFSCGYGVIQDHLGNVYYRLNPSDSASLIPGQHLPRPPYIIPYKSGGSDASRRPYLALDYIDLRHPLGIQILFDGRMHFEFFNFFRDIVLTVILLVIVVIAVVWHRHSEKKFLENTAQRNKAR